MFSIVRKPVQTSSVSYQPLFADWDPFRVMESLLGYDTRTGSAPASRRRPEATFVPRFDVKETKEGLLFQADLPGLTEADVEISLTGNQLSISGKRLAPESQGNQASQGTPGSPEVKEAETHFLAERTFGAFSRTFTLPASADTEKVKASMKDGVLTLVVPKRTEAQPRKVTIGRA